MFGPLIALLILAATVVVFAEPPDFTAQQTRLLAEAEAAFADNPKDPDALLWKGRRLGDLGRYEEAIGVYEAGEALHLADARFARHISHRLISLRRFAEAAGARLDRQF